MLQSNEELKVIACEFLKKWNVYFHHAIETDLVNVLKEVRDNQSDYLKENKIEEDHEYIPVVEELTENISYCADCGNEVCTCYNSFHRR